MQNFSNASRKSRLKKLFKFSIQQFKIQLSIIYIVSDPYFVLWRLILVLQAWIRYDKDNKAKEVLEKLKCAMGGCIQLKNEEIQVYVLEGNINQYIAPYSTIILEIIRSLKLSLKIHL